MHDALVEARISGEYCTSYTTHDNPSKQPAALTPPPTLALTSTQSGETLACACGTGRYDGRACRYDGIHPNPNPNLGRS